MFLSSVFFLRRSNGGEEVPFAQVFYVRARQLFFFGDGDERTPFSGSTTKRKSNRFNSQLFSRLRWYQMYMCGCHTHKAITICIYIYIFIYCDGWGIFDLYTNVWCRHLLNESYIRKQKKLLLACNNGENTFLFAANNAEMKFSFIKQKSSAIRERERIVYYTYEVLAV